jgi:hypothetical protein
MIFGKVLVQIRILNLDLRIPFRILQKVSEPCGFGILRIRNLDGFGSGAGSGAGSGSTILALSTGSYFFSFW